MARARKPKSAFGRLRDRPRRATEYEELVFGLYWTPPYYMPLWSDDSTQVRVESWDDFRDPAAFSYHTYVLRRAQDAERIKGCLDTMNQPDLFQRTASPWIDELNTFYPAMRYYESAGCMAFHDIKSSALGEYVSHAFSLQGFDEFGHVCHNVDLCRFYRQHVGGFDRAAAIWDEAPDIQPLRRLVEDLMVIEDWAEAIVAFDFVLEQVMEPIYLVEWPRLGLRCGDPVLWSVSQVMWAQESYHADLARAFVKYVLDAHAENRPLVQAWIDRWFPRAAEATRRLFGPAFDHLEEITGISFEAVWEDRQKAIETTYAELNLEVPSTSSVGRSV